MLNNILSINTNSSGRLDANDYPLKLSTYISSRFNESTHDQFKVDLSPLIIEKIILEDRTLLFKSAFPFYLEFDKTQHLLCIKDVIFGIDVYAENRSALYDALIREIKVIWFEYALEADANLTAGALALKHRLLENIEEVLDAT